MATRASAKRKRGSAPVSPPSDGRAARRARGGGGGASAAAAAEQEEPPTLVDVRRHRCLLGEEEAPTPRRVAHRRAQHLDAFGRRQR